RAVRRAAARRACRYLRARHHHPRTGYRRAAVLRRDRRCDHQCHASVGAGAGRPVWQTVPPKLRELTAKMLSPEPADRFEDGNAALRALGELREPPQRVMPLPPAIVQPTGGASVPAVPYGSLWARLRRRPARRLIEIGGVAGAVILLMLWPTSG